VASKCFEGPHGELMRVEVGVGNGGMHIAAYLLVPEGAGKRKAVPLKDVYEMATPRKVGPAELEPVARVARLCPLSTKWGDAQPPTLEQIWNETVALRASLERELRRPQGKPLDEAAVRRSLEALHHALTNYLAAPAP